MAKKQKIDVKGTEITIIKVGKEDYISLTDMIQNFGDDTTIKNWLRNRHTVEFLGIWETINNPNFNWVEFDLIRNSTGLNTFVLSTKRWIESTNAIGIRASAGRYGGTFAQKDIAFEFGTWLSPEFKLYLIKEFQRLKDKETDQDHAEWNLHRILSKVNYHIHTAAIKETLIPDTVTSWQRNRVYASEADLLNVALFGETAAEWRNANPALKGNMRDYATIEQLIVLANIDSLNAVLLYQGLSQADRLDQLNQIAISQLRTLLKHQQVKALKKTA